LVPQPWKYATRRCAVAGAVCALAHFWNVRPANFGTAASRCTPTTFSTASRNGLFPSVKLAIGAAGVPRRPSSVGRAISRSRSLNPCVSLSFARACVLISAMCTPCGHTCVQTPHPEQ
jgi:hypothetical protein